MEINEKLIRDLRNKFDVEMNRREIEVVEHWKNEIEIVYKKKYEGMSSLQVDIKNLVERMTNRIAILNRMVKEAS